MAESKPVAAPGPELERGDLLLRQLGSVAQARENVLTLEGGILGEKILYRITVGQHTDDLVYRDTGPLDAKPGRDRRLGSPRFVRASRDLLRAVKAIALAGMSLAYLPRLQREPLRS